MNGRGAVSSWSWTVFGVSLAATAIVLGALEVWAVTALPRRDAARARKGWVLVDVLKAPRELVEGTTLSAADLEVGPIPEQFATASVLRPAQRRAVERRALQAPMQRGDWLTEGHFVAPPRSRACVEAATRSAEELGLSKQADVVEFLGALKVEAAKADEQARQGSAGGEKAP